MTRFMDKLRVLTRYYIYIRLWMKCYSFGLVTFQLVKWGSACRSLVTLKRIQPLH